MGLAASQGRYLSLTARNSDLVYEGQQISQERLALSKETRAIAEKYNEAMNNKIMQVTTPEGGTQQLTYEILTSTDPFSGLSMRIVDAYGSVVIPGNYLETTMSDENGNPVKRRFSSSENFIKKYMPEIQGDEYNLLKGYSLQQICAYYSENYADSGVSVEYRDKYNSDLVREGESVLIDVNVEDPAYLHKMLTEGGWTLQQATSDEADPWASVMWQASSAIDEVYDTSDDAAAEAEYETATKELQRRDEVLELRLEQVQTEQKAVQTEIDSVKSIIKQNVKDSFGTFA